MQAIKLKMQTLTKERDAALARVAVLEERVKHTQSQTADTDSVLGQIASKTEEAEQRLEKSQATTDASQQKLNEAQSMVDEYNIRLNRSLKLTGQDAGRGMAARYEAAKNSSDGAVATITKLNQRIEQLEEHLQQTDERVSKADSTVERTEVELRGVVDSVRAAQASKTGGGSRAVKLQGLLETKERAKSNCDERIREAETKGSRMEKRMVDAEQEVIDWQRKAEDAKKELDENLAMLADI